MPPTHTTTDSPHLQQTTLGGGCFWCLEAAFNQLDGVVLAESGYSNGHHPSPSYEAVCSGTTGHAEVVRVTFDPERISYRQLLTVFFSLHDPTTLNRQGNDVGTQYRSGIYTHDAAQAETARQVIGELSDSGAFDAPIVTEIAPVANYHAAEAYHQGYVAENPYQGYCAVVVRPKLAKFQHAFGALLKAPD
ncbi:peptide-methionine (S)-S-oxide reductase MsrA [Aquabacterium sp.]|uniref:peptide-methionine (S)-S-oxide reductase MsrA n=1 Tax=Aquabacterium sp. TaxID=1872578 RepID=UPI0024895B42|nr:peptide-methionine (S)-S-oxide reductase MsrA [Aquabacterium sp.]MDI1348537.1 peptide-methionine (S)-S-oxide reductase MsrA [Aquabacterium sp.]